jgi:hypothetical protein
MYRDTKDIYNFCNLTPTSYFIKTYFFRYLLLFIAIGVAKNVHACDRHPPVNHLPNHKVSFCEENAFNRLKIKMTPSDGSLEDVTKSGYFIDSWFEFQGEFEKRPSAAELIENYCHPTKSENRLKSPLII